MRCPACCPACFRGKPDSFSKSPETGAPQLSRRPLPARPRKQQPKMAFSFHDIHRWLGATRAPGFSIMKYFSFFTRTAAPQFFRGCCKYSFFSRCCVLPVLSPHISPPYPPRSPPPPSPTSSRGAGVATPPPPKNLYQISQISEI